jgi:hypothetical protein
VLDTDGWTERPFSYKRYGESGAAARTDRGRKPTRARPRCAMARMALVLRLPNQMIVLVGRDLGEPERFRLVVRRALMVALSA